MQSQRDVMMYRTRNGLVYHRVVEKDYQLVAACHTKWVMDSGTAIPAQGLRMGARCTMTACQAPAYRPAVQEPGSRYVAAYGFRSDLWNCKDCGSQVTDRTAHDRHHDLVAFGDPRMAAIIEVLFAGEEDAGSHE